VSVSVYEWDRLLVDVLVAGSAGLARDDLGPWIRARRSQGYALLSPPSPLERALRWPPVTQWEGGDGFPRSFDAVWDSPHERTLDVVGIDYYDPVAAHHIRLPGHRTAGGRSWQPGAELWDDRVDPGG